MKNNKTTVVGIAAIILIGVTAFVTSLFTTTTVVKETVREVPTVGAIPGGDIYTDVAVKGTFTRGGGKAIATSTTATSYTMVMKDLDPYSVIDIMENVGSVSLTLPATSTMMAILKEPGATRQWLIHNATTTAAITMTLVAGTGMDLVAVTANDDVIDGGEYTQLTCTQIPYRAVSNENIVCIVDELADAD